MAENSPAFRLWNTLGNNAAGRWLFAKLVCFRAPYFASISPKITKLEENLCIGSIDQKRSIQNHMGSVHAIALCNLAELCGGLLTDVSVPSGMRWIPKGMTVNYLQKAFGRITARATPANNFYYSTKAYEARVFVSMTDAESVEVASAEIKMWLSPKTRLETPPDRTT